MGFLEDLFGSVVETGPVENLETIGHRESDSGDPSSVPGYHEAGEIGPASEHDRDFHAGIRSDLGVNTPADIKSSYPFIRGDDKPSGRVDVLDRAPMGMGTPDDPASTREVLARSFSVQQIGLPAGGNAVLLVPARPGRRTLVLYNRGAGRLIVGADGSVTPVNGFIVQSGSSMELDVDCDVWGLSGDTSNSCIVCVYETYTE